jgi:hypothetical protein
MMTDVKPSFLRFLQLDSRRRRSLAWSGGLLFLFPSAYLLHPLVTRTQVSICFFRTVLHRPCPLCGLTRAFACATRGDLARASDYHPLWWMAAGVIVAVALVLGVDGICGTTIAVRLFRLLRPLWPLLVLALAVFGVWRWL